MLVFISDLHLTDGTSGQTIKPTAFKIFAKSIANLVETVKPLHEVKLVLLGDIFDVIRSAKWLDDDCLVRPWDPPSAAQEQKVKDIVFGTQKKDGKKDGILEINSEALDALTSIKEIAHSKNVNFSIDYAIGNHDSMVNCYRSVIAKIAAVLGWKDTPSKIPEELFYPEYQTYACHGHRNDAFNSSRSGETSSLGDAIVIELLNRFPLLVEKRLRNVCKTSGAASEEINDVLPLLKEIDNVRPLLDAPSWLLMVLMKLENVEVRRVIEDTWHECVSDFFKVPFVRSFDKFLWPDLIDALQVILNLSCHTSSRLREKMAEAAKVLLGHVANTKYSDRAFEEPTIRSGKAKFVVYGHTHEHQIVPLDQVGNSFRPVDNVYFNTGTWRKTWNQALYDNINREFIGWHVLTYIAIFKPEENGDYNFEFWNSALGENLIPRSGCTVSQWNPGN